MSERDPNLELMAMRWLWLEHGCHYVIQERTPRYMMGQPDVMGVTKARYLTEIEIKRSLSDFAADMKKTHRQNRSFYMENQPRQFYYLVPIEIAEKILARLPEWAGLMVDDENQVTINVLKPAPVNKESKRLSIKECVSLARQMVSHMMSVSYDMEARMNRFKWNDDDNDSWVSPDQGTYKI